MDGTGLLKMSAPTKGQLAITNLLLLLILLTLLAKG